MILGLNELSLYFYIFQKDNDFPKHKAGKPRSNRKDITLSKGRNNPCLDYHLKCSNLWSTETFRGSGKTWQEHTPVN